MKTHILLLAIAAYLMLAAFSVPVQLAPVASPPQPPAEAEAAVVEKTPTAAVEEEATPAADVSATPEAAEEVPEATEPSLEGQIAQLAQINVPPRLSDRELGIHIVPCDPNKAPGADEVEDETYFCGIFTVPQNWDEPDGRNLDMSFVVAKANGENPEPDPVIYLAGGPGQSAIVAPIGAYEKLRPTRDLLRLDQRGTGFSQRLGWEECLVLALQNDAAAPQIEALRAVAVNPLQDIDGGEGPTPLTLGEQDTAQINQACWDQFSAQGLDLNQFTTAASARDVVEFVKALEYESFNIHGVSYGTRLAMAIMKELPGYADVPELRSVVLDSVFPPSVYLISSTPRSDHDFILQLLEDCRSDDLCREAYPNLEGRLGLLLERLEQEPLTTNGETVTIDDVVRELANVSASRAGYMPKMFAELEMGVLDTYLALRDGEVGTGFPEGVPGMDLGDPVQAFILDAVRLIGGNVDLDVMFDFVSGVDETLAQDAPREALQAFITENFTGDIGDQLLEMLGTLTAEDIATSPYVAQILTGMTFEEDTTESDPEALARAELARQRTLAVIGLAQPLYNAIHCAEDIQFERFEDAVNSFNDLAFPQFSSLDLSKTLGDSCQNWPVEAAPIQVKDPVSSSVPALILQGAYDTRTPVYMGKRTARELENSTYVLVPQKGHEVWSNAGGCIGQIATAFIQNPDAALDLSCLEARQPQWVLPDDAGMETPQAADAGSAAIEATFVCSDGTSIDTVFDNVADTVTVTLADGTVTLPRVESGSGARYGDDSTTFWNWGDEALVEVDGEIVYENCVAQD